MKAKLYRFLGLTSFLIAVAAFSANAQEGGMPSNEIPDLNLHTENPIDEKPLLYDPEKSGTNSQSEKVVQNKEQSSTAKTVNKSKTSESSKGAVAGAKEGDDALSFNFLYYIIQKFKISDIVEQ